MIKVNYNSSDGTILGYYPDDVGYVSIPEPAVEIDETAYRDAINNHGKYTVVNGKLTAAAVWPPAPTPPSIVDAQEGAWTAIKVERDRRERLPLDYLGKQLDFDALSSDRLTWAIAAARSAITEGKADFKLEWTCADNSPLTMTAQQIVDLPIAVAQRSDGLHRRARELRAAIDAAKTVEDVQKIKWSEGA